MSHEANNRFGVTEGTNIVGWDYKKGIERKRKNRQRDKAFCLLRELEKMAETGNTSWSDVNFCYMFKMCRKNPQWAIGKIKIQMKHIKEMELK